MTGLLLVFVSALFAYAIVTIGAFPALFGLALSCIILATLIIRRKKQIVFEDTLYYAFVIILSVFISLRSNNLIQFFDIIAIFYFGSLLILNSRERLNLSIFQYITLPVCFLGRWIQTKNTFGVDWRNWLDTKKPRTQKSQELIISILITIAVLFLILPLLSSANPLFSRWLEEILVFLQLTDSLKNLFGDNFFVYFIRTIMFAVFFFFVPRIVSYVHQSHKINGPEFNIHLPLFIPKFVTLLVLFVFFISQAQLYFATDAVLKILNLSHSQYAREVFGQLSVVAFIIFGLVYMDKSKTKNSRHLTYLLVIEGIFLSFIALKSAYDYSSTFGFTHKRLLGYTVVVWTWGIFSMFLYSFTKNIDRKSLLKNTIIYSGIILLAVNLLNFDYLIYHTSKARTGEGIDYPFLATLSPDSYSYHEQLELVEETYRSGERGERVYVVLERLLWRIERLQRKYNDVDWRTFNLAEYRQYQQIKSVDPEKYYAILREVHPDSVPTPIMPNNVR